MSSNNTQTFFTIFFVEIFTFWFHQINSNLALYQMLVWLDIDPSLTELEFRSLLEYSESFHFWIKLYFIYKIFVVNSFFLALNQIFISSFPGWRLSIFFVLWPTALCMPCWKPLNYHLLRFMSFVQGPGIEFDSWK